MKNKNLIILCLIIVVIAIVISIFICNYDTTKQTHLEVLSNSTLYNGENITIKLTHNTTAIKNESVNITLTNSEGWSNTVTLITDGNGTVNYICNDLNPGNYTVTCEFYGNKDYKSSNMTFTIEIKEKPVVKATYSKNYDNGAFYSDQAERTIYTGEIMEAPDGNSYKHLGNNKWEQV